MTQTPFLYPLRICQEHLDAFGHVNNAVYLQLFEVARWEMLRQVGLGMPHIQETGLAPAVLEAHIRYHHELRLGAEVFVHTNCTNLRSLIWTVDQWMDDAAGKRYCEASFTLGLFDVKERRLRRMPREWREALRLDPPKIG